MRWIVQCARRSNLGEVGREGRDSSEALELSDAVPSPPSAPSLCIQAREFFPRQSRCSRRARVTRELIVPSTAARIWPPDRCPSCATASNALYMLFSARRASVAQHHSRFPRDSAHLALTLSYPLPPPSFQARAAWTRKRGESSTRPRWSGSGLAVPRRRARRRAWAWAWRASRRSARRRRRRRLLPRACWTRGAEAKHADAKRRGRTLGTRASGSWATAFEMGCSVCARRRGGGGEAGGGGAGGGAEAGADQADARRVHPPLQGRPSYPIEHFIAEPQELDCIVCALRI